MPVTIHQGTLPLPQLVQCCPRLRRDPVGPWHRLVPFDLFVLVHPVCVCVCVCDYRQAHGSDHHKSHVHTHTHTPNTRMHTHIHTHPPTHTHTHTHTHHTHTHTHTTDTGHKVTSYNTYYRDSFCRSRQFVSKTSCTHSHRNHVYMLASVHLHENDVCQYTEFPNMTHSNVI